MSAVKDPTHTYRYKTLEAAQEMCEKGGYDYVVELKGPEYEEAPFMCIRDEWIQKKVSDDSN